MGQEADLVDVTIEEVAKWHALEVDAVLEAQNTRWDGLSPQEAEQRLKKYGKNELTPPPKVSRLCYSLGRVISERMADEDRGLR